MFSMPMFSTPRFSARRRGASAATLLLFAMLLANLVARPAAAIQLHWAGGATALTVSQDTQAVLVVQADAAEVSLPNTWTLQWTADSTGLRFSAFDPSQACLVDTAKVDSILPPQSPADSAANLIRARFCSDGNNNAATAYFLVDLPAGGHGKLKVVALDPADTTRVIESSEVTFNGGIDGDYAPTVLRVTSDHRTTTLRVEAIGSDLTGVEAVSLSAPELGQPLPLSLLSRTDSEVVASAILSIPLPACEVRFGTSEQQFSLGELPADEVLMTPLPYRWRFQDPDTTFVYPKDFAMIDAPLLVDGEWRRYYHLYYIRHYTDGGQRQRNEFALGHAWSPDLENWNSNRFAFVADTLHPTQWDGAEVWAPSIIKAGGMYHLFYTGLDSIVRDQTIGYATAASLDTTDLPGHWARRTSPTLTPASAGSWVYPNHPWEFRDPFVMADPDDPSRLLMFYTARPQSDPNHFAVGVFRSASSDLDTWADLSFYERTTYASNGVVRLESPHVFPDSAHHHPAQSAAATWRLIYTDGGWTTDWQRAVLFNDKVVGAPLTDTRAVSWIDETGLGSYLGFTTLSPEYGVQASEILQIGGTYYWGGYNGEELVFRKLRWGPPFTTNFTDFTLRDIDFLAVEPRNLPEKVRLRLAELRLGQGSVRLRIELPAPLQAEVAVYDVMGRLVRRVADRPLAAGATDVTWDGRDLSGAAVGSGIYFARLRAGGAAQVVRVPLVR